MRALRTAMTMSGLGLAQASGVSRSMLSRIERGLVSPSVDTLERIARGLGVPVARFFADQAERMDFSLVRRGQGMPVDRLGAVAGYHYELLGHLLSGQMFVEPYLVRLDTDAPAYANFQHPGLKFIHLLNGRVKYRYGPRVMDLEEGDSLLFDASALHGVEAIEARPVAYLSIVFTLRP
ncbi:MULTISPECIES: helix-turn-helix domain-containing protein [Pseudacidovorax]|uniref:helix-turn-helix domain-containing protein n=1 Tax=Pseudacidovorax TaxID=433923 RepID=UPI0009712A88|nr:MULTISPECIES: XRE family transcriptional regulator [Pseudacidovorax]